MMKQGLLSPTAPEIVSVNGAKSDVNTVTAQQGDDVKLTCEATGKPTPELSWSKKVKNKGIV